MQFEIRSRWSGAVVFTAEIAADSETPTGIKLGLAVKTAVKAGANLSGADLSGANLSGADLRWADLGGWERRADGIAQRRKTPASELSGDDAAGESESAGAVS